MQAVPLLKPSDHSKCSNYAQTSKYGQRITRMRGSREGGGAGSLNPPPEKSQKIGFPSNTDPESLKNQASSQCWVIIGSSAKRHFNCVSLASR